MNIKRFSKVLAFSRLVLFAMFLLVGGMVMADGAQPAAPEAVTQVESVATGLKYISIAIMMACGSFAASLAVGKIGTAAMGAAVEKPELLGKAIAFVGLGEGIALFGFLISLFLLNK